PERSEGSRLLRTTTASGEVVVVPNDPDPSLFWDHHRLFAPRDDRYGSGITTGHSSSFSSSDFAPPRSGALAVAHLPDRNGDLNDLRAGLSAVISRRAGRIGCDARSVPAHA